MLRSTIDIPVNPFHTYGFYAYLLMSYPPQRFRLFHHSSAHVQGEMASTM